ncbi:MAG TPA: DnaB-like helicase N-terminal domain-containing protein [Opitutaceae bacterium]|nr:DnaB-like helicase N-terminal domain-containing protein [Opitutaceae bacterium]
MIPENTATSGVDLEFADEPAEVSERRPPARVQPTPRSAMAPAEAIAPDVEEQLLSCCLIDGSASIERALSEGITVESFDAPANQILFRRIAHIFRQTGFVDVPILAEELKAANELKEVGGFPKVSRISQLTSTTAHLSYFLQKIREQHASRDLARLFNLGKEQIRDGADISELAVTVTDQLEAIRRRMNPLSDELRRRLFDPAAPIPNPRVVLRIGDTPICTAGNISAIVAQPKAGKSAVIGAILAACMADPARSRDCLGFAGRNVEQKAVLHFDTEQSKEDFSKLLHRSKTRAAVDAFPAWLRPYHLTGMGAAQCRMAIERALVDDARAFNGIHALLIDGIGDTVVDPNDEAECFPWVTRLHDLAIRFDTAIVAVLHLNPGSEKTRGHLGSQLERKAESNLTLEKDADGVSVIYNPKPRGALISKDKGPRFRWSTAEEMHVSVAETIGAARAGARAESLRLMAEEVFEEGRPMKYGELKEAVKKASKCQDRTAETKISELRRLNLIAKTPIGTWELRPCEK